MRTHPVMNFLLFTCFLVVGYTLSIRFYQPCGQSVIAKSSVVTTEQPNGIPSLDNGQRSVLLVGASTINSTSSQLESIWLVTYFPVDTTIQLLPIFPSGEKSLSSLERQLNLSFHLDKVDGTLKLDQGFTNLLAENNYWWSGYIIFDEGSLPDLSSQLSGIRAGGKTGGEVTVKQGPPSVIDDPHNAYVQQVELLRSICHRISNIDTDSEFRQWISLLPQHILTDFDSSQLQMELEILSFNLDNRTCRFPTLEISRVEP